MLQGLTDKLSSYLDPKEVDRVKRAYHFSEKCHLGQMRQSGDPYITHPLAVANILADLHMDHESLIAALLHDVIEDTGVSKGQISRRFGRTVADLVDGVSKLGEIESASRAEQQAESFQKMTLAMSRDIRVMLVKLADRLHNMRTLGVLSPEKRRRIARETIDIYAPIAQRLGINDIRLEFEDLGFAAMYPLRHRRLREALKASRKNRKEVVTEIHQSIEMRLESESINVLVKGREKHLWSIYLKMREKKKSFRDIMDVFAFRLVVDNVDDCYRALGIVHNIYKPVPGEFKDYIAIPKANGYQSLHTVLVGMHGVIIEVQIRTKEMEAMANFGIAAHWEYKSGRNNVEVSQRKAARWVQGLLEMQQQAGDSLEFLEHVKADLFPDEVYVFTPKGKIVELPTGATPIDFAYSVHTGLGDSCIACNVDGELKPLSEPLQSGQKIEIISSAGAQPNPNWLNFVVTAKARSAIRHFLKNQQHDESVDLGKRLLDQALGNLGSSYVQLKKSDIKRLLKETGASTFEYVLQQIGLGNRVPFAVANIMILPSKRKVSDDKKNSDLPVVIDTSEGLIVQYGRCCHPIPGDPILGHMSPGKGIVIHLESCRNLKEIRLNPEKCMPLVWSSVVKGEFAVELKVEVTPERGFIAALAARMTEEDATIEHISVTEKDAFTSIVDVILTVRDRIHLADILRRARSLKPVRRIYRVKNK
ncbi:bifunctional (p)ppGpp synthetase/guanosine-3',5'-bis(diphosphate) 3'-pyrophosphohydrolase [Porticoccaceae bacterium]|nr:bifunctional (p)ppGpp synthetase/guanosine-3',5'-bis(diphosphate) 3'-pyrophosphohydrolase [Porticoccaceae bacterium]MDA7696631.1 bifunctional (p)ppGpp synthetase/guanosine-3',5'-bis(diphosphate) 3'-pyrophosphohydrolase [Porticoccaceae bacterium]MDA7769375.1 bifunctional (p)ppGpp synthetase/guanosine-3',5'-bis(diphosphate) 3'-pyrophosphohydrolase [Porticoccaceae bacterium]MDA8599309.1 bifunctional (p)ppGpp synthetase/guanosine-3',5'-bis(diphosphate) 3'-pyrophosphohydrolase [Porticoccaceae bact